VPFIDKNGEPMEPPAVLHGLQTMYFFLLSEWPSTCGRRRGMLGG
jgi:hypothetical protein